MSNGSGDLEQWCKQLPKVELHAHLNGCIRNSTLKDLYSKKFQENIELPQKYTIDSAFKIFAAVHKVVTDLETLKRVTREMIEDFSNENVKYLEIRTTPKAFTNSSKKQYVELVLETIKEYQQQHDIMVKLLLSINRGNSLEDALDTVELANSCRSSALLGIDFSGNPELTPFRKFLPALNLARDKYNLRITAHFAEIKDDVESKEILEFNPNRLGHGTFLNDELVAIMKTKNIPLEICMTSNVLGNHVSDYVAHHFRDFYTWKYPISLNTDDTGLFHIDLTHEYYKAATTFNLSKDELFNLAFSAISQSFASDQEKTQLQEKFIGLKKKLL